MCYKDRALLSNIVPLLTQLNKDGAKLNYFGIHATSVIVLLEYKFPKSDTDSLTSIFWQINMSPMNLNNSNAYF